MNVPKYLKKTNIPNNSNNKLFEMYLIIHVLSSRCLMFYFEK